MISNLIQDIVFAVFGLIIILVSVFTVPETNVIVIGALLLAAGVIGIVLYFLEKKAVEAKNKENK